MHCGQTLGQMKMKLGMQAGLGPGHIALDGDPDPTPPKGYSPPFLAHICCGQMSAWIKTPLGMELGLGPRKKSAHIYCGQTAAWIKMALGMEVSLSPGDFVVNGDPAPPQKGGSRPIFGSLHFA